MFNGEVYNFPVSRDALNAHRLLMQALERDTQNPVALADAFAQGVATTQP